MSHRMSAGWGTDAPSPDQLKEFMAQVASRRITHSRLQRFLTEKYFPTWKTITLGMYPNVTALIEAYERVGIPIDNAAKEILKQRGFRMAKTQSPCELVCVSKADLGVAEDSFRKDIYAAALQGGHLAICPAEVGPLLRLHYLDQPQKEWLRIGMSGIPITSEGSYSFTLNVDGGLPWLVGHYCHENDVYDDDGKWVFCRRK